MKNCAREKRVRFVDRQLYEAYLKLREGKFEETQLAEKLDSIITCLKENPFCGIKIPSALWPKEYVRAYQIDNLRKIDLHDGWRLIYTLTGNDVEIVSILLEWFPHKEYEKRFGYKNK